MVEQAERSKARKERTVQLKEDDELLREYMKEAKKDADTLDSIESDEMNWNGLE